MEQPTITFVLNGKTFSLRADDSEAISAIPAAERRSLLALLEAIKKQDELAASVARRAVAKDAAAPRSVPGAVQPQPTHTEVRPDRLGSGDVDALMARLAMEESNQRKPALTRQGLYRVVLGIGIAIVLLVLIF